MVTLANNVEIRVVEEDDVQNGCVQPTKVLDNSTNCQYHCQGNQSTAAAGDLCDGSDVIILVNQEAHLEDSDPGPDSEGPGSDLRDIASKPTQVPSLGIPLEAEKDTCNFKERQNCDTKSGVNALDWFHDTFSQVEKDGCISLNDFKHTAKTHKVSPAIT